MKIRSKNGVNKVAEIEGVSGALGGLMAQAQRAGQPENGDYYDSEGFLVCGKCHTRRQVEVNMPDLKAVPFDPKKKVRVKMPVSCRCRAERRYQEEQMLQQDKDMRAMEALKRQSLMDERLRDVSFDSFRKTNDNAYNLKLCLRYANHFDEMLAKNQGLLFYGGVGTGKTFAAACIANHLLNQRIPVIMTSFVKLLESMQGFSEDDSALIARLNRAKLLIIDDLGAERSTDYALEKVYDIVDSRYRAKLPIILTTNLSMTELKESTDIRYTRIYDRIFEMCYPMQFKGQSWRKVEAARRFDAMKNFLEGNDG
jgi:DNA replication protein DnaC|nr:MAG TPA: Replicative helicase [Caudoviricetes sp.]